VSKPSFPSPSAKKRKKPYDLHSFLTDVEIAAVRIVSTILFLYVLYRVFKGEVPW
jgi:hypothetical protein